MFRRTFWFTAGAAAGVWATTKVNRKLKQLTPESLAAQAADKASRRATGSRTSPSTSAPEWPSARPSSNDALGLDANPGRGPSAAARRRPARTAASPKHRKNPTYVEQVDVLVQPE